MVFNWSIYQTEKLGEDLLQIAEADTLVARLLSNRSIKDFKQAQYFLDLKNVKPSDSLEIPEMDKAFLRVQRAIDSKENIVIYGDYDVDGTTSVALLVRAFKMIGIIVDYYIPSRHTEGYGLNKKAIKNFKDANADLLITCDCGISNYEEVAYANDLSLDVIVTDHHSIPENPPPSFANCNPKTLDEAHPLHWLPGVGVAYKLAELILDHYIKDPIVSRAYSDSLLDLVALGMVADLAPLRAENRYLTKEGLKVLANTEKPGLIELMEVCGIRMDPDAEHIGFGIAPRINAAGRLAEAKLAVELMITEDRTEARRLSEELDSGNKERQLLCEETFEEAMAIISETIDKDDLCIPIAKEGWHHGVIGIVASRIVERFNLPVFIMAIEEGIAKGSVRSITLPDEYNGGAGIDIFKEMQKIQEKTNLFLKFGGHKAAAGFSVKPETVKSLISEIKKHFNEELKGLDLRKTVLIDTALKLREVNSQLLERIEKLAPYGMENPQPKFVSGSLIVKSMRTLGKDAKHLKLYLCEKLEGENLKTIASRPVEAVIWNRAEEFLKQYSSINQPEITIVYTPKINDFRGEKSIQLDIKDWDDPKNVDPSFFARFNKANKKLLEKR